MIAGLALLLVMLPNLKAQEDGEDGYRLWLRYDPLPPAAAEAPRALLTPVQVIGEGPTFDVLREELVRGLRGLLDLKESDFERSRQTPGSTGFLAGTPDSSPAIAALDLDLADLGSEGFLLQRQGDRVILAAQTPKGLLYGGFALLRLLQTGTGLETLDLRSQPDLDYRVVDHWDNPDGSIERGYAGQSIFWSPNCWEDGKLTPEATQRITDYARACASLGLNTAVLNNVNADDWNLSAEGLDRARQIAGLLRPYGMRVGLVPPFDLPMSISATEDANPENPAVRAFWQAKVDEIYGLIPDFVGFLVKADSEGRPGPHRYKLTHDYGANMLAEALEPYGGIVMWRAFMYGARNIMKAQYEIFKPLDGKFADNVFVQPKFGPRDFQPREIFNPLFGGLPDTQLMIEFQITQEYLGHEIHLTYLAPLWREILDSDTYAKGPGSTVQKVLDGTLFDSSMTGAAAALNIGQDRNWSGHHFHQANWYAFGRLTWDLSLSAEAIAEEWIALTFSRDPEVVRKIQDMMMGSWEAGVDYRGPLGMMMTVGNNAAHGESSGRSHYGPGPEKRWVGKRIDTGDIAREGIGRNRGSAGNDMVAQFHPPLREKLDDPNTVPLEHLLFFHFVPWDFSLQTGRTVWEELVHRYHRGVDYVEGMQTDWQSLEGEIDPQRFEEVSHRLDQQVHDAVKYRDAWLERLSKDSGRELQQQTE